MYHRAQQIQYCRPTHIEESRQARKSSPGQDHRGLFRHRCDLAFSFTSTAFFTTAHDEAERAEKFAMSFKKPYALAGEPPPGITMQSKLPITKILPR